MKWQPIETAPNNKVVLVQHCDDLFPDVAYQIPGEKYWLYDGGGPEDVIDPGGHKHFLLPREPTHWMPLPDSPMESMDYRESEVMPDATE